MILTIVCSTEVESPFGPGHHGYTAAVQFPHPSLSLFHRDMSGGQHHILLDLHPVEECGICGCHILVCQCHDWRGFEHGTISLSLFRKQKTNLLE
jgi:hypothetical protein